MTTTPTLSGAQHGKFRPWREVPGGICLIQDDKLVRRPCAVRIVPRAIVAACQDYARQYLSTRGDKTLMAGILGDWATFFLMHHVLIEVPTTDTAPMVPLCPMPVDLADKDGKIKPSAVAQLGLNHAADGQLSKAASEYELLKSTETPDRALTHAEWEALITEGKAKSLATLHLERGSSALIQLLHGLGDAAWPE
jgi:hypothetical protein